MKLKVVKYIVFIYSYFWIYILRCLIIEHSRYMTHTHTHIYIYIYMAFFWLVNISKNSILNQVAKFNLFISIYFCFFVFEWPLKDFPFYSPIFLILWLHGIKEGCKCLSSKLFFATLNKSLKFKKKKKSKKNVFYSNLRRKLEKTSLRSPPWG